MITEKASRFRALSWPERRILFAAVLLLPLFAIGLRSLGFARFQALLDRQPRMGPTAASGQAPDPATIGRLVNAAARHSRGTITCLTRSMLLRWLLARRGIASELRIGVRIVEGKLDAHAWVEHAGAPINDTPDVAGRYAAFGEAISLEAFSAP